MSALTHRAERQEDGSILFLFKAGDSGIQGVVPTVDEYRYWLAAFEGHRGVRLPGCDLIDGEAVHAGS